MLKKLLTESGISPSDIYVTNVVKCAGPVTPKKQFTSCAMECRRHLDREFIAIKPKFELYFGVSAAYMQSSNKLQISEFPNDDYLYVTHSFEELYRHGIKYYNHALTCMKEIKEKL